MPDRLQKIADIKELLNSLSKLIGKQINLRDHLGSSGKELPRKATSKDIEIPIYIGSQVAGFLCVESFGGDCKECLGRDIQSLDLFYQLAGLQEKHLIFMKKMRNWNTD